MAMQMYMSQIGAAIGKKNGERLGQLLSAHTTNPEASYLIQNVGNCAVRVRLSPALSKSLRRANAPRVGSIRRRCLAISYATFSERGLNRPSKAKSPPHGTK